MGDTCSGRTFFGSFAAMAATAFVSLRAAGKDHTFVATELDEWMLGPVCERGTFSPDGHGPGCQYCPRFEYAFDTQTCTVCLSRDGLRSTLAEGPWNTSCHELCALIAASLVVGLCVIIFALPLATKSLYRRSILRSLLVKLHFEPTFKAAIKAKNNQNKRLCRAAGVEASDLLGENGDERFEVAFKACLDVYLKEV